MSKKYSVELWVAPGVLCDIYESDDWEDLCEMAEGMVYKYAHNRSFGLHYANNERCDLGDDGLTEEERESAPWY